jgi:hypothetical protein
MIDAAFFRFLLGFIIMLSLGFAGIWYARKDGEDKQVNNYADTTRPVNTENSR